MVEGGLARLGFAAAPLARQTRQRVTGTLVARGGNELMSARGYAYLWGVNLGVT